MSNKVLIIGLGGTGKAVSQLLFKHDVFIAGAYIDHDYGTRISNLLRQVDFFPYLYMQRNAPGERRRQQVVKAFERSASCALLFGPDTQSPFADECLRSAIRDRVDRTRGEFRVIPILLPGASEWLKSKHFINEMCGFKTKRPVRFEEGGNEKEALHQLILAIRGIDPKQLADWQGGWFRELVRWRAANALNVDWAKLRWEARDSLTDIIASVHKERSASDYEQAAPARISEEEDVWRLSYQRPFSSASAIECTPTLTELHRPKAYLPASPYYWFAYQQPDLSRRANDNWLRYDDVVGSKLRLFSTSRYGAGKFDGRPTSHSSNVFHVLKGCAVRLLNKFGLCPRTQQARFISADCKTDSRIIVEMDGWGLSESSVGKGIRFYAKPLGDGLLRHFRYEREFEERQCVKASDHYKALSWDGKMITADAFASRAASVISVRPSVEYVFADHFKQLWEASNRELWEVRNVAELSIPSRLGVMVFGHHLTRGLSGDDWLLVIPSFNVGCTESDGHVNAIQDFELYEAPPRLSDIGASRLFVFTSGLDSYGQDLMTERFGCNLVNPLVMNGRAVEEDFVWNRYSPGAYNAQLVTRTRYYRFRPGTGECQQPQLRTTTETNDEGCGRSYEEHDIEDSGGLEGRLCQLPKAGFFLCTLQQLT
jgi:hypothetical protein